MWAALVVFVIAPAILAGIVLGAISLFSAVTIPWGIVIPTGIILIAIWISTALILAEIRRR